MSFTMIYYWVPEDNDDPEEPNAFGISKAMDQISIKDIREAFPLVGKYHFRFKNLMNKAIVWMDLNSDDCIALSFQNRIIVKATRISWENISVKQPTTTQNRVPVSVPQPTSFNLFDSPTLLPQAPKVPKEQTFDLLFHN